MTRLSGIFPAIFTPMEVDGKVDLEALDWLVDRMTGAGVDGLYVCGTTGEGLLLSIKERQDVAERCQARARDKAALIVHVGAVGTAESIELARHAERLGADAVASIPPPIYGRSKLGIRTHYRALAEATSLPLYIYTIPSLTGVRLSADDIAALIGLPNVRGMKFSDVDLFEEYRAIQASPNFDVFHGSDETLLQGLTMGAVGGVGMTYNFMPWLYVELFRRWKDGNLAEANELQRRASQFVRILFDVGGENLLGVCKRLLARLGRDCGRARRPIPAVPEELCQRVWDALVAEGFAEEMRTG